MIEAVIAGCLLVVCAFLRPDVAVGLLVLGAVFVVLERRWPVVEQRVLRRGWSTDVVHFVVDQVAAGALVAAMAWVFVPLLEPLLPNLDTLIAGPLRLVIAALIGEVAGYWGHRAMHRVPWLWRLHAVHHSSPTMDWLAPNRRHVLDTALGQAASLLPLLALGLSPPVVASAFVLRRAQGLFVHANVRIHMPGIRWIVATPEFHHWHHSADPADHDRNFAGQCPIVDLVFGTLHLPAREWPVSYGLSQEGADLAPAGYVARLRWPFRDLRLPSPRRAVAGAVAAAVVVSTGVVTASASPPPPTWSYRCELFGERGSLTVAVGPTGVVLERPGDRSDVASLTHFDGDPSRGIGIWVVRRDAVPLTIRIGAGPVGAVVPAWARGADGTWSGTCSRLPDQPDRSEG